MSETLFPYYERELDFFRKLAQDFAKLYPAAASRLPLEPNQSTDPHDERLIEAFALLSGRIHHKIDDEFPELTHSLLGILYPHYLAPIPSLAIVQFELDPGRAQLPNGFLIERHSKLHTQPVGDLACKFRTGYPVTLWPVELAAARYMVPPFPPGTHKAPLKTQAVLRLQIECQGDQKFSDLSLDRLRFFLSGDNQVIANLYELLFNNVIQVVMRPQERDGPPPVVLTPEQCLFQVGFERDEGLLPYPNQSFLGYRLLTEFFAFPSKFWFVDLGGFRQAARAGYGQRLEVFFFLNRTLAGLEQAIDAQTFRL